MENENRLAHWENVFANKSETELSWFQESPSPSLRLLRQVRAGAASSVIDIGAGSSRLVDSLLGMGFLNVTALDWSGAALQAAKKRLGDRAADVHWVVADVTTWQPVESEYDIWRDRAAFPFLADQHHRTAYVDRLARGLKVGGHAIIGTTGLAASFSCSVRPICGLSDGGEIA